MLQDYGRCWRWEDCPWWHRERPNLSIFSGALWRSGAIVLEEFAVKKESAKVKSKTCEGRCDLSFIIPSAPGRPRAYDAESKHVWCDLGKASKFGIKRAENALDAAVRDISRFSDATNPLAIAFVSFVVGKEPGKKVLAAKQRWANEHRHEWTKEFVGAFENAGCSLSWFLLDLPHHEECPGSAVILKSV